MPRWQGQAGYRSGIGAGRRPRSGLRRWRRPSLEGLRCGRSASGTRTPIQYRPARRPAWPRCRVTGSRQDRYWTRPCGDTIPIGRWAAPTIR